MMKTLYSFLLYFVVMMVLTVSARAWYRVAHVDQPSVSVTCQPNPIGPLPGGGE